MSARSNYQASTGTNDQASSPSPFLPRSGSGELSAGRSKSMRQAHPSTSDDPTTTPDDFIPPPPSYDIASSPYSAATETFPSNEGGRGLSESPGLIGGYVGNGGGGGGTSGQGQDRPRRTISQSNSGQQNTLRPTHNQTPYNNQYNTQTSTSPPTHTQSYQAYAPVLPPSSYNYLGGPYDGYAESGAQGQGRQGGPRRRSAEEEYGAGAQDTLSGMFSGLGVRNPSQHNDRPPSMTGRTTSGSHPGSADGHGAYSQSGGQPQSVNRTTSTQRLRQRTYDGIGSGTPYSTPSTPPAGMTGPHASTYSLDSGLYGGVAGGGHPSASLRRHDTSSSGGYGQVDEVPRRPLSGSGSAGGGGSGRDRSSRGSMRSLSGLTPQYQYGQESPPPVPAIPSGALDQMGLPMGGSGFLSNDNSPGFGIGIGQSPYGQPQSSASSYALSMTGGPSNASSVSTGRVVRNVSSASSLSLSRQPTTNIGSSNARRQGVKKAIDVNKPPFTKEFVDDYRARMKGDPDPEAQFAFAKYMIEAARIVGDDMGKIDPKSGRRYRDSLLSESLKLIKKLAEPSRGNDGYAEAQFFLANMIGTGQLGLQVEYERSYQLYMQASKQNHPAATYRTAVCNELGAGTRKEPNRAVLFYRKAATLRDTAAMYKLGMILLGGLLSQPKNQREGVQWLRRASQQADEDNPHSLHELAMLYENPILLGGPNNQILPVDHDMARSLYTQAAQLGYAPSQFKLGTCYEYGTLGCQVDPKRSIAWLSRAAEKGESEAELALSGWFLTGAEGILKQSDEEAYLWARKAANKGLPKGEYAVAYYTEVGIGVKKDLALAQRWYMRAAAQGNDAASKRLLELRGNKGGAARRAAPSRRSKKQDDSECVVM